MNTSKSKQFLSTMMAGCVNKALPKKLTNAGNNKQPTANVKSVEVEDVSFECLKLLVKVSVHNPYCFPIPNCEITFSLKSIDREIVCGNVKQRSLKANDDTLVDVRVTALLKEGLKTLYEDIVKDWAINYTLDLIIVVDVPFITCCKKTIRLVPAYKGDVKLPTKFSDVVDMININ